MTTAKQYGIRYNLKHKPYLLISCTNGHPIECVNTKDGNFGGSAAEARLAFTLHRCADCEAEIEVSA